MNTSSPFSPLQARLILCANAIFILVALWNLIRNFHRSLRLGQPLRFTPVALAILATIIAAEAGVIVFAPYLVPQHPTWFPVPPILSLVTLIICSRIDEQQKLAQAHAEGGLKQTNKHRLSDTGIIRLAIWYARVLALSIAATIFSLYGQLFGPQSSAIFAIIGFLLSLSVFLFARQPTGHRFVEVCPHGLSGPFPTLAALKPRVQRALMLFGACAFLSIAVLFISARTAGSPADSLPALAVRDHYVLTNHSRITEVSSSRFFISAVSSLSAWHTGTLFATVLALHALMYGELPQAFRRRWQP